VLSVILATKIAALLVMSNADPVSLIDRPETKFVGPFVVSAATALSVIVETKITVTLVVSVATAVSVILETKFAVLSVTSVADLDSVMDSPATKFVGPFVVSVATALSVVLETKFAVLSVISDADPVSVTDSPATKFVGPFVVSIATAVSVILATVTVTPTPDRALAPATRVPVPDIVDDTGARNSQTPAPSDESGCNPLHTILVELV